MHTDHERCVRAVQGKDARFDGQFITGVTSTGIYCRPSCPARTPAPRNMRFYPTAAAAHRDGFRACKRCLPDATPGSPEWNVRADVVARAIRLIDDGLLDRADVPTLAATLGYSPRHLERLMRAEVGAGPLGLARAQRAQTARTLIERSDLPLSEIAWAAGFGSIRTFNETIQAVYGLAPRDLRSRAQRRGPRREPPPDAYVNGTGRQESLGSDGSCTEKEKATGGRGGYTPVPVRLPFRPPIEPRQLFGHLIATAVPGVEEWTGSSYRRTARLPHGHAIIDIEVPEPNDDHVRATVLLTDLRDLTAATHRTRWLLDLDADPATIDAQLAADPLITGMIATSPGRRVPRCLDPEELAIRVVLGQQISTRGARRLTGDLVAVLGDPITDPGGTLTHLFPTSATWAGAPERYLRMPATRRETIRRLAHALSEGLDLGPGADWSAAREALTQIRGIGPWTIESIAMRALGDPDAFIASDLGVSKAAHALGLTTSAALLEHAERWRPWRAYAVQHLWASGAHDINDLP
ncbi:MAG: Ada metal-binding domain-containing protein [Actinomycetia bacterium]|nr:Ada metal-binding domain-containing protein [Actinomycetes bacterium]